MKPHFKIVTIVNTESKFWVNLNHVATLHRVKFDPRTGFPEHTKINITLRNDLEMILRVKETPEDLTSTWV